MNTVTQIQILDAFILRSANTLENGMHLTILSPTMGK